MNYSFQFSDVFAAWPLLVKGTLNTIELSLLAMVFGLMVAIVCAWGKTAGPQPVRWVINAYIELIRNTPFLVQIKQASQRFASITAATSMPVTFANSSA